MNRPVEVKVVKPHVIPTMAQTVVIAGAGPAGCAAAIALRKRGHRVVAIDRARFPRDKVCGDVILPAAAEALHVIGLDPGDLVRRGEGFACPGARYVSPSGREFSGPFQDRAGDPRPWTIVRRMILDAWLVDAARRAGAEIREETEVVSVLRDGVGRACGLRVRGRDGLESSIEAGAVIGADGASSATARSLGVFSLRAGEYAIAARGYASNVRLADPYVEIHTAASVLPGCAWIVPTMAGGEAGEFEANVGLGFLQRADSGLSTQARPADVLREAAGDWPHFALRWQEPARGAGDGNDAVISALAATVRSWYLPFAVGSRERSGNGWILAGDAAAMIDPLTGHGIHIALIAGRLAGETIAQAIAEGDVSAARLSAYDRAIAEPILREAARGLFVRKLHGSALFANGLAAFGALGRNPESFPARAIRPRLLALIGHSTGRAELLKWWKRRAA